MSTSIFKTMGKPRRSVLRTPTRWNLSPGAESRSVVLYDFIIIRLFHHQVSIYCGESTIQHRKRNPTSVGQWHLHNLDGGKTRGVAVSVSVGKGWPEMEWRQSFLIVVSFKISKTGPWAQPGGTPKQRDRLIWAVYVDGYWEVKLTAW